MAYAKTQTRFWVEGGWLMKGVEQVCTPDEQRVLDLLGLEYMGPQERIAYGSLRVRRP